MENQEIDKKQQTALATGTRKGFGDGVDHEDLIIPRLYLVQNMPPKKIEIDRKLCPPGTMINSLTAQPLKLDDQNGVPFIPILRGKKWIRFNAQEKGKPGWDENYEQGAKIWESRDRRDPRVVAEGKWDGDNPPLATEIIEFLVLVEGEDTPLVLGFSRTSFGAGKTLTSMAQFAKRTDGTDADLFEVSYRLRAQEKKNNQGHCWYQFAVGRIGSVSGEALARARALFEQFANADFKTHGDEEDGAAEVSPKQPWE